MQRHGKYEKYSINCMHCELFVFNFLISAFLRGYTENCYHTECDDLRQLTRDRLKYMAKISDSLYKTLDMLGKKGPSSRATGNWSIGECL